MGMEGKDKDRAGWEGDHPHIPWVTFVKAISCHYLEGRAIIMES